MRLQSVDWAAHGLPRPGDVPSREDRAGRKGSSQTLAEQIGSAAGVLPSHEPALPVLKDARVYLKGGTPSLCVTVCDPP
jgi:hypothetical protein